MPKPAADRVSISRRDQKSEAGPTVEFIESLECIVCPSAVIAGHDLVSVEGLF